MRIAVLLLACLALVRSAHAQAVASTERFVGSWQGTLDVGAARLRLGLTVARGPSGALVGTLTSIDQGNAAVPAVLTVNGDSLTVAISAAQITYASTVVGDSLRGRFTQGAGSFPLVMARVAAVEVAAPFPYPARLASDAEIRAILARRVDVQKRSAGIVVGIIDPDGRRVIPYGRATPRGDRPLDGRTVFEIGSITKTFTALLLADMARRGEVTLEGLAGRYLPAGVRLPERGRAITLADLATHMSGLPRLPANLQPRDAENPYADYSVEQLYQFVSGYSLPRDVGSGFEYSNLGAGLLGHLLSLRAERPYEALLRERVLEPLGMRSTAIALTPEMASRMASGHDVALRETRLWDLPTLAGAGALRSTADDMLRYLEAHLRKTTTPLDSAIADALDRRPPLAWGLQRQDGHDLFSHDGGTGGFRSFVGFDPGRGVGVVVLSNSGAAEGVSDIGRFLLLGGGLLWEGTTRTPVEMAPSVFDRYVGRYQLAPGFVIAVTREQDRFYVQATGQPRIEVLAEGPRDFFLVGVDAQITFEVDAAGRATAVVLHQNGRDQRAPRIE